MLLLKAENPLPEGMLLLTTSKSMSRGDVTVEN